ncbi:hypothetical protein C8Q73DRAFT_150589 [Cubamyces lactineus]|nr:hypothetical protein C8Q73DRAFT_150589 [Cubamyces lactineus]
MRRPGDSRAKRARSTKLRSFRPGDITGAVEYMSSLGVAKVCLSIILSLPSIPRGTNRSTNGDVSHVLHAISLAMTRAVRDAQNMVASVFAQGCCASGKSGKTTERRTVLYVRPATMTEAYKHVRRRNQKTTTPPPCSHMVAWTCALISSPDCGAYICSNGERLLRIGRRVLDMSVHRQRSDIPLTGTIQVCSDVLLGAPDECAISSRLRAGPIRVVRQLIQNQSERAGLAAHTTY